MSSAIIDVTLQCEKIIKELSIIAHDGPSSFILKHYVFLPPTDVISNNSIIVQSRYNQEHIHGLSWNCGNTPYARIPEILKEETENIKFVYSKGVEKCRILRELLPGNRHVNDLMIFGCPNISTLLEAKTTSSPCLDHQNAGSGFAKSCSMVKILALSDWLLENQLQANLFDTAPRLATFRGVNTSMDPMMLAKRGFYRNSFEKRSVCCVFCEKSFDCSYHSLGTHDCMGWCKNGYLF